jgi:hypothetical protein
MKPYRLIPIFLVLAFYPQIGCSQVKLPPPPSNAALLYWQAFAEMQDYATDSSTADLLERTVKGEVPWDEQRLGHFVDDNLDAIRTMQRASKLPECDWGLEDTFEARNAFPVTYWQNSARSLARLNTLYGIRQAASGDSQEATDTWLAGIRFSQHLAQGGTLIFKLVAEQALLPNFEILTTIVRQGKMPAAEKAHVRSVVETLPETVFDWGEAWALEGGLLEAGLREVLKSPDPIKAYEAFSGERAPEVAFPPSAKGSKTRPAILLVDFSTFEDYMSRIQAALTAPSPVAQRRIETLEAERKSVSPLLQRFIPSPSRVNDARAEIALARQRLLQAAAE